MRPWVLFALVAVMALCLSPLPLGLWADHIVQSHGCDISAGLHMVCEVAGREWGTELAALYILPWMLLFTMPVAAIIALVLCVLALRWALGYMRGK